MQQSLCPSNKIDPIQEQNGNYQQQFRQSQQQHIFMPLKERRHWETNHVSHAQIKQRNQQCKRSNQPGADRSRLLLGTGAGSSRFRLGSCLFRSDRSTISGMLHCLDNTIRSCSGFIISDRHIVLQQIHLYGFHT